MRISYKTADQQSDADVPVIDIYYQTYEEAFDLGMLFERMSGDNRCALQGENFIRIPLSEMGVNGVMKK